MNSLMNSMKSLLLVSICLSSLVLSPRAHAADCDDTMKAAFMREFYSADPMYAPMLQNDDKALAMTFEEMIGTIASRPTNGLTECHLFSIFTYTGNGYQQMNADAIRQVKGQPLMLPLTDKALDEALQILPPYVGDVYSGQKWPVSVLTALRPGLVLTIKTYLSSSTAETSAFGGSVKLILHSKSGRLIEDYSEIQSEHEVLFGKQSKFKIDSIEKPTDPDFPYVVHATQL